MAVKKKTKKKEKKEKKEKKKKKEGKKGNYPFEVRRSGIQGRGVFATRRIRPGQRIIEYCGERIGQKEEDERYNEENMTRHHTFLFRVTDEISIDGNRRGSQAKFINHSCDPNCEAVDEEGRIYIEAIKNIQPGVELAYDYSFEQDEPLTEDDKKFYFCRCGSPKCRGTILKQTRKRKKKKTGKKIAKNPSLKKKSTKGTKKRAKKSTKKNLKRTKK